jgi:riboflavin biosynthesis pyrimidine reductase
LTARILQNQDLAKTLIVTSPSAPSDKVATLKALGIELLTIPEKTPGRIDLARLLDELGKRQIASLLIEGGSSVITAVLREGLADRLVCIVAPKIIGLGIEAVGDLGLRSMDEALHFSCVRTRKSGGDIVFDLRRS